MGAVTVANVKHSVFGDRRFVTADVTFSTSYATGGDTGLLTLLGLKATDWLKVENKSGLMFEWDETNELLLALFPTGGGGALPTTLATAGLEAGGAADNDQITPGVAVEVGSTADLSALVGAVRVAAVGI